MDTSFICIEVGGVAFKTKLETLRRFPNTRLGSIAKLNGENVSFETFDRNPALFPYILDFYRMGELHLPSSMCAAIIKNELEFWQIDREYIADCCLQILVLYEENINKRNQLSKNLDLIELDYKDEECKNNKWNQTLRTIWLIMDKPHSSTCAFVYSMTFMFVTVVSVFIICCSTHSYFRTPYRTYEELIYVLNATDMFNNVNLHNPKHIMYMTSKLSTPAKFIETSCLIFFTLDFCVHFFTCPVKKIFFTYPMNLLDGFLIITMWTVVVMEINDWFTKTYMVFKSLTIFRIFRLLRLVKQHSALNILTMTLFSSKVELILLVITFLITSIFFASFIYFAEIEETAMFPDMFSAMWWAIVTITTVGYGDLYPKSLAGKIVGSVCVLVGVMIIALPVAIIATNFNNFCEKNKVRERRLATKSKKKRSQISEEPYKTH